jgi:hypothetical protein
MHSVVGVINAITIINGRMISSGTTTPLAEISTNHSNKNVDIKFSTHKTKIFESLIIEKIFGSKNINAAVLLLPKCYTLLTKPKS